MPVRSLQFLTGVKMGDAEDDIAVVGIGCNFPGGEGLDSFWKVLLEGKNCAVPIPIERFDCSQWYDPDDNKVGKSRTAKAALIDGFNLFDHKFFGITETEVEQMDPQQKYLLQCTYRALENAGIPMEKASGSRTGVFLGLMNRDYEQSAGSVNPNIINHCTGTGLAMSLASNRVSYVFNFTGPSMSIDSACSSSLVALHFACQAIRQGDCEMALCGGVSCIIQPRVFVALSKAKMISPEGTSKPFSSRADGYGRGEGCGVLLLKPLKQALKENDNVWGIIRKTAVNQDGRTVTPITKPSMVQQEDLLRRIYSETDLSTVQYIEAHGTGTPVGDPIEAGSISKVIAKARPPGSETLRIGSVKGNIGHTESAAGVAGLIKVLLMMKHETIVSSLFYSEDSASIDAKALNIKVPTEAEKWGDSVERVAGINNFGFGGTNAHVIVKQHKQTQVSRKSGRKSHKYFVLSASSEKSISMMMEDTIQQIDKDNKVDLEALAYTSACRRSHLKHKYKKAFRTSSLVDLKDQLKSALSKTPYPSYSDPRLIFVFCGNGVTYQGMCKELLKHEPVFREKIREVEMLFQMFNNMSILERLESESESKDFSKPDVVQPLLFAIQVGIASLFKHWGIKPDAILGHSVGEVAAAHCSGLLSLEDAVKVIYFRSTLQSKVTGGKMLVVSNMAVSEVLNLLPSYLNKVCLAASNSPQSCTLAGDADAIDSLYQKLSSSVKSKNLFLHVLDVPAAYHSQMMDPILSQIEDSIGSLQVNQVDTELFSTVTGKEVEQPDFSTGKYWARNIREPVSFEQAVRSATKDKKNVVFVEIGPRRALQRNIQETLGNDTIVMSSVQPEKDHETMLTTVSKLFESGVQINWDQFYRGCEASPTPFPVYHFEVCGCFTDKEGRILVELKHVMIKYLGSHSRVVEEYFFHNDFRVVSEDIKSSQALKALVFSDQVGVSKAMQPHLSSMSKYISFAHAKEFLNHGFPTLLANLNISDIKKNFEEVLFMWGEEDLTSVKTETVLENIVNCCEIFRQIVLELRASNFPNSIRVITYRSAENTVDRISPGFALSGMTRACAAEMADLSFQLIDISSVSTEDIRALSEVLKSYPCSKYQELVVKDGLIFKSDIVHTPMESIESSGGSVSSSMSEACIFQTADPYRMTSLSAISCEVKKKDIQQKSVEIQLSKISVHSSDYFPVSVSDLHFGKTMYWNKHTFQNHQLLALDFSGTVTAVGKDVSKLKVGDHVVSCYPVLASSAIMIPEEACYKTKRLPFLKEAPCVSYFVLAWEILYKALTRVKEQRRLGIISSVPDSGLLKVLAQTANKSGWNVIVGTQCNGLFVNADKMDAFVLLPPFDEFLLAKAGNFPGVRHIVIVCESQSQCLLAQSVFQNVKDSVRMQTLQMSSIIQRGSLIAQKPQIYRWLKSMHLDRKSFVLEHFTFQRLISGSIDFLPVEESESYFSSKTLPVVALGKDDSRGTLSKIPLLPQPNQLFQNNYMYIVTGGLTGLGFETVKFISQKGGEYIVILSRSSPTPDIQKEICNLEKQYGVHIICMGCDVSVSEHVLRAIGLIGKKFPSCPIRGVFHSAVVLHDGLIETLDKSLYEKVLKPKVNGALNLHHATKHCKLDYFVCYSSVAAFIGNVSQTNYAAANSFLDIFCHYRRNIGLAGQSINWGPLNLGLLLNKDHFQRFLEAKGLMVMDVTEIRESLEQCLQLNKPQQAICKFNFKNMKYNVMSQNASLTMRMTALVEEAMQKAKLKESRSGHNAASSSPSGYIRSVLSETIGVDKNELNDNSPLSALGIDSMLAMTLQNLIFQERGVNVPLVKLLDPNSTLSTLISNLMEGTEGESQNDDQKEGMIDDMFTRL
uniref:Fatty acid synthase 2 n=1 Tax=Hucho hucho TaxID=62062 RepID=A0A4W5M6M5_9TELE